MLHPDHGAAVRGCLQSLRGCEREFEAGLDVVEDQDAVPECLAEQALSICLVRERQDGVGVGVIDELRRDESVYECFNRGRRRAVIQQMGHHLVYHRLVGNLVQDAQLFQIAQVQSGIAVRLH